jgi:glycolate oxidase
MKQIQLEIAHFSSDEEDLSAYGFDASGLEEIPAAVAWPESTQEVQAVLRQASQNTIAVIPRGAGTGMTGGSVPVKGAIVLSFERMNRLLELDEKNLTALVEPGLINGKFQRRLYEKDLFYPPDPASMEFCTLGGNVAENAGGPRALKYGVTKDYVLSLEAVLPDGRVINTGVRTQKGVVGYDLTRLLVGSEGTLAAITGIRLRLLPAPQDVLTLLVIFKDVAHSGEAVSRIIASKIIPRTLEFMDRESIRAVEDFSPAGFPQDTEALLLIELDGHPAAIQTEAERVADICRKLGAELTMAGDEDARGALWRSRRAVSPALYHLSLNKISEDIVVPRSNIPQMLTALKRISEKHGVPIASFGHAGDGNIHVNLLPDEKLEPSRMLKELFSEVLALGGTISGEHGIGITKKPYLAMEIKPAELGLMKDIRRVFDPKGILNPGKIFP